jgi:hypothetical protein
VQELNALFDGEHEEIARLKADNDDLHKQVAELRAEVATSGPPSPGQSSGSGANAAANDNAPAAINVIVIYSLGGGVLIVIALMGGMLWQTRRELRALKRAVGKKAT